MTSTASDQLLTDCSCDSIVYPDFKLYQPKLGYRFNIDSLILARLIKPRSREKVADLCSGCGIIALLLAKQYKNLNIIGFDISEEMTTLATINSQNNKLLSKVNFYRQDLTKKLSKIPANSFGSAYLNPPYYPDNQGLPAKLASKQQAKHAIKDFFKKIIKNCRYLLKSGGNLHLIVASDQLTETFNTLEQYGFAIKRLRNVHGRIETPAKMTLLSARLDGKPGLIIDPPLILYRRKEVYTKEAKKIVRK